MIRVRVLAFGVLKDALGAAPASFELPQAATVADLLAHIAHAHPHASLQGIAVSVNADYATALQPLRNGDEVGLLPPVSGGASRPNNAARMASVPEEVRPEQDDVLYLTRDAMDAENLVAAAKRGEDGAVVVFDGIVRNNSRGRETMHLDYEAYEEMALKQIKDLAAQARERFGIRHVTIVHRLGHLHIGETSVLIIVASSHRAQAFDACRWLIDTLKKTVPIWKKETFADGAVWADGEPFPDGLGLECPDAP
jgi:molybdopterin synthase catalytic subunit/molybdopterin converting factor small subunit